MAPLRCRVCGGNLDAQAKSCPWCGSAVGRSGTSVWRWVVLPMLVVYLFIDSGNNAKKEPDSSTQQSARHACEQALLKSLSAQPSMRLKPTSQWPVEEGADGTLLVHASALATNAVGTNAEQVWDCALSRNGDGLQIISLRQSLR